AQGPDRGALQLAGRHDLTRRHARLDALANDERGGSGDGIELHGRAMDKTEHAAIRLRPALRLIETDAVNGGDLAIINRAEGGKQRGNALGAASILVPPRATRVEAQHGTGEVGR